MPRSGVRLVAEIALAAVLVGALVAFGQAWLRAPALGYALNDDAPSHVAATVLALSEHEVDETRLLPVFTFGDIADRGIDNLPGSSVESDAGLLFYTSFPPGAFVLAAAVSAVAEPSLAVIRGLGLTLAAATTALLFLTARRLLVGRPRGTAWAIVIAAAYLVSPVGLQSAFFGYWGHSVVQVALAGTLLLLATAPEARYVPAVLLTASFAAAYSEWTGILIFVVIAVALWFRPGSVRLNRAAALSIGAGVLTALALTAYQWSGLVPLSEIVAHMTQRADARGLNIVRLAKVFWAWALAMVPLVAITLMLRPRVHRVMTIRLHRIDWYARLLCTVLLVGVAENLVLAGHAGTYVYDTNKVTLAVALLAAVAVRSSGAPRLRWAAVVLVASLVVSVAYIDLTVRSALEHASARVAVWSAARQIAQPGDLVVSSDCSVRGAQLIYVQRNVVECADSELVDELTQSGVGLVDVSRAGGDDYAIHRYVDGQLVSDWLESERN
ncbi:hypothetical protein Lsed01_00649 [Demequina sediminis]|uniref:Glycosyltransferase RgtA/B/C/D-like domain-containing protein n=1 Tax=Demequina sediminis TaxID=1930058 RepID=A0ABP9WEG6_9MICO